MARLERLGVLHYSVDFQTGVPRFNRFSGKPEGHHGISALGRLVLKRVGLLGETASLQS
jgi:hypothetical protein